MCRHTQCASTASQLFLAINLRSTRSGWNIPFIPHRQRLPVVDSWSLKSDPWQIWISWLFIFVSRTAVLSFAVAAITTIFVATKCMFSATNPCLSRHISQLCGDTTLVRRPYRMKIVSRGHYPVWKNVANKLCALSHWKVPLGFIWQQPYWKQENSLCCNSSACWMTAENLSTTDGQQFIPSCLGS